MSTPSNNLSTNNSEPTLRDDANQEDQLEDLLRQLHGQIKSSNWLDTNTASKLEQENPELISAWKSAIESENSNK